MDRTLRVLGGLAFAVVIGLVAATVIVLGMNAAGVHP